MTYVRFLDLLEQRLLETCTKGEQIRRVQILKNNDVRLDGFCCQIPGHREQPTVYVNHYYRKEMDALEITDIAEQICRIFQESMISSEEGLEQILNYEKMKTQIFFRLVSRERNRELLEDVPYIPWLDLAIVFYLRVPEHIVKNATAVIHKSHMKNWKITVQDLYQHAARNHAGEAILLHPMEQFLDDYGLLDVNSGMYILSNACKEFGAAVIVDPRVQKMCAQKFGEDYYVLPSSIHEVILLPASKAPSQRELNNLVKEVNRTCVNREEYLSDHVYFYSSLTEQLQF